jgi:putative exosortase-associated protein (TIGR04073 family)
MRRRDRPVHQTVRPRPGSSLRRAGAVALLAPVLLVPASALAQEMTPARKVGRGLAGITTFFLDLPGSVTEEWRANGAVSGLTAGLATGMGRTVVRPVVGVYELVTAPFEMPEGYEPILAPEYPWNYFRARAGTVYGFTDTYLDAEARQLGKIPGAVVTRRRGALVVQFPDALLFATGSAELSEGARTRLRAVAKTLEQSPETRIEVLGYTDATGPAILNRALSEKRADAVRRALVELGVDGDRVASQGFGDAAPVASNYTPQGRRSNRRVEIEVRASGVGARR